MLVAVLALVLLVPGITARAADCAGDCNLDGQVAVDDILTLVTIAIGDQPLSACPAGDLNADNAIAIDDILAAVASAVDGCPTPSPTPTPTPTSTPTPTTTPTPPPTSTPTTSPAPEPSETATASPTAPDPPTATSTPSESPTRTATQPAAPTATPSTAVSPSPATATPTPYVFCREPAGGLLIPDGNASTGVTDSMTIPDLGGVTRLRVHLTIQHGFVGDLIAELEHVDTESVALLLDAPGHPITEYGCDKANVDCIFDDSAVAEAELMCNATPPAIGGSVLPIDPLQPLAIEAAEGTWELTVYDEIFEVQGRLVRWCIEFQ